ncbi:uncharacterized protein ACMZJ9_009962 [Mantella aurantiaca]
MDVIFTDVLTSSAWIVSLLGISAMAFFLGCASCRQHKSREGVDRRPPPPTPEIDHNPRYQEELFPPTPFPAAAYSIQTVTREYDNDYEDDFEELPAIIRDQLNKSAQSSAPSQKSTRGRALRSSIESGGKESLSESRCHSYENVVHVNESLVSVPVMRKDHTYLEVLPSNNDSEMELPALDKGITSAMRSSVESEGKVSVMSQSSCHSYENVIHANGSPFSAVSDLEGDYVNFQEP